MFGRNISHLSLLAVCLPTLVVHVPVRAGEATIIVDETAPGSGIGVVEIAADGLCSLREAVINANDGAATHADCAAGGDQSTVIVLPAATFTFDDAADVHSALGASGLPLITGQLRIEGNGAQLRRNPAYGCELNDSVASAPEFRIVRIDTFGGSLALEDMTLSGGCQVSDNDDTQGTGGAIYSDGPLILRRVSLIGNGAFNGGALHLNPGGGVDEVRVVIEDSTVADNFAAFAGAIDAFGGVSRLRNTTISANQASEEGGALWVGTATLFFEHVSLAGNQAPLAGTIFSEGGRLRVKNSLFDASSCIDFASGLNWQAAGMNLDSGSSCADLFDSNFDTDVLIGIEPLADNGGPTLTHALSQTSPARDAAPDCTDFDGTEAITHDQRGQPRPAGPACDIGAYEYQLPPEIFADRFEAP
jgi:hypothetical protein